MPERANYQPMNREPRNTPTTDDDQRRQFARLRFDGPLEAQFRRDYEDAARVPRITILLVGMLLVAVTPLYDDLLLGAPEGFLSISHMLQFGVQIPVLLLALLMLLRPALRPYATATGIAAVMTVAACLMAQHVLGKSYAFNMPHDFAAIAVAALLVVGRMRFWQAVPWMSLTMIGTTYFQIRAFGIDGVYDAISNAMLFVIAVIAAFMLEHSARQTWYRGRLLEFQATRDGLTGLPNRRHFDLELRKLVREAVRSRKNVALLILDIDHFKAYNDHFGHPTGDQCLRVIGEWLASSMRRPQDFCARLGGEEFAAVWFDAGPDDALRLAEALRTGIDTLAINRRHDGGGFVSASGGFAQTIGPDASESPENLAADLIKRADGALYAAKRAGRERLVRAESDQYVDLSTGQPV